MEPMRVFMADPRFGLRRAVWATLGADWARRGSKSGLAECDGWGGKYAVFERPLLTEADKVEMNQTAVVDPKLSFVIL